MRHKEDQRIFQENYKMGKRILLTKPEYNTRKMNEDYANYKDRRDHMQNIKRKNISIVSE